MINACLRSPFLVCLDVAFIMQGNALESFYYWITLKFLIKPVLCIGIPVISLDSLLSGLTAQRIVIAA